MTWLLTAILCVMLIELMMRLPLPAAVSGISTVSAKALHVLTARGISDHWKEKVLLAYARNLFIATLKLAGLLLMVAAVALGLILVFDGLGTGTGEFIGSVPGLLYSTAVATGYFLLRRRLG